MIVDSSTEVSPAFTIEETGDYGIILTTTSAEGCTSTKDWKGFHVDAASSLDIPNVFTPNGDGVNDYFQVKAVSMETFNGVILDRWGRKIFEWTNCKEETAGWDGTNGSSKAAPGVYFYIIKAVGKDEVTYDESGTLYLFRDNQ
jgi:gliding motility-associated-like protein